MILEALSCVTREMNDYFKHVLELNEDKVILSAIMNQDGTIAIQGENKVVITLINIQREAFISSTPVFGGPKATVTQPISINLHIMVSAYCTAANYAESLRYISRVISFFQQKNPFTAANTPGLDPSIEKLQFEMVNPDAETLNSIWATLGAKYMPSLLYKMRMLNYPGKMS